MSNNVVSQPLSVPKKQTNPISDKLEASIPNLRMDSAGSMSNSPRLQHFEMSKKQMGSMEQQFLLQNQQVGDMEAMMNNMGSPKILLPSKRTAVGEPIVRNYVAQPLISNKNVARVEAFNNPTGMQQLPSPNKKPLQVHSNSSTPLQNLPAATKKMVRNESIAGRSGTKQPQTPKNRTTQMEPSAKVQTESFESVRSKMRESLASALALVIEQQDKTSNEESNSENQKMQQDIPGKNTTDSLPLKGSGSAGRDNYGHSTSQGILINESMGESAQTWKGDAHLIQCNAVLLNEDVSFGDSFFVKDDLLQGNGLAWAMDLHVDAGEMKETQIGKKPKQVNEDVGGVREEKTVQSPKSMAFSIELELFKLFGGVNKKYKEKGRSLLFNLKDRNNPELRERVMTGELPPERLCSMTAEELASKELSQWRIAKAEEFAQMVVLPDSDVDIRRLVRKTHKGEFQVEVDQDDGVSVEVSVGTSALTRLESKNEDTEGDRLAKADEIKEKDDVVSEKSSSESQDLSCSLTIPNDGTDLLQGLMVDEFKDADFLPPIVSLDEFMESLDSEPPFENLPMDDGKTISPSDKENSDLGSKGAIGATPEKSDKVELKFTDSDVKIKFKESPTEPKSSPPDAASRFENLWEGELQLNISDLVTVVGFFKSGEKTSTKEWTRSLEIKGRVRLDAFEKFIQDLPMSRSRALMVVHFVLKEGSSENDRANLSEVVHSYVVDERLGFAEPAPGVELYFCPPQTKIVEMLCKHLSKDHTDTLNSIDSGLIGIIVWRKPHLSSAISPNSSSHHKHSSKKHHLTPRRNHEKDSTMNANFASKQTLPPRDDDDDIPPGFGPLAARDEDDLPEFNFSGPTNPSLPKNFNPNQVRELIHKYGQPGKNVSRNSGVGTQRWNNDDDDIPEWQPQPLIHHLLPPQPLPMLNFQPPVPPHMVQGLLVPPPQGGSMWWQPPGNGGLQPSNVGTQPSGGQYYGAPSSRGF